MKISYIGTYKGFFLGRKRICKCLYNKREVWPTCCNLSYVRIAFFMLFHFCYFMCSFVFLFRMLCALKSVTCSWAKTAATQLPTLMLKSFRKIWHQSSMLHQLTVKKRTKGPPPWNTAWESKQTIIECTNQLEDHAQGLWCQQQQSQRTNQLERDHQSLQNQMENLESPY